MPPVRRKRGYKEREERGSKGERKFFATANKRPLEIQNLASDPGLRKFLISRGLSAYLDGKSILHIFDYSISRGCAATGRAISPILLYEDRETVFVGITQRDQRSYGIPITIVLYRAPVCSLVRTIRSVSCRFANEFTTFFHLSLSLLLSSLRLALSYPLC